MSLLEIKNVSKIYGPLKALDNVNLTVENGEWLAIMGPSGSGKSTMMRIPHALRGQQEPSRYRHGRKEP